MPCKIDIMQSRKRLYVWNHVKQSPRMWNPLQDVADGVSSLLLGRLPSSQRPLVLVGGNCSIQGFDASGAERCRVPKRDRHRRAKTEDKLAYVDG